MLDLLHNDRYLTEFLINRVDSNLAHTFTDAYSIIILSQLASTEELFTPTNNNRNSIKNNKNSNNGGSFKQFEDTNFYRHWVSFVFVENKNLPAQINSFQPNRDLESTKNSLKTLFYCYRAMINCMKIRNQSQQNQLSDLKEFKEESFNNKNMEFQPFEDLINIDRKSSYKQVQGPFIYKHKIPIVNRILNLTD